jgi:hypothetical protein
MTMAKLTKRTIDALRPKSTCYFVWNSVVVGFGVRVLPSGTKTYQVQYRKGCRTRRSSLGRVGVVALAQARDHAREMLGQVAGGYATTAEVDYFLDAGLFYLRGDSLGITKQDFVDCRFTFRTDCKVGSFSGLKRPPIDSTQDIRPLLGE